MNKTERLKMTEELSQISTMFNKAESIMKRLDRVGDVYSYNQKELDSDYRQKINKALEEELKVPCVEKQHIIFSGYPRQNIELYGLAYKNEGETNIAKKLAIAILAMCAALIISIIVTFATDISWLLSLTVIILAVPAYFCVRKVLEYYVSVEENNISNQSIIKKWNKKVTDFVEYFENSADIGINSGFIDDCQKYETAFSEIIGNFPNTNAGKLFIEYNKEYKELQKKESETRDQLTKEYNSIKEKLDAVTIIQPDLFEYAYRLSEVIRLQRADSVKEAINIVLEDVRKEEEERQRREEAYRQEEILEEQARVARDHQERMERAAQERNREIEKHNREMERNARLQLEETRRQAEEDRRYNAEMERNRRESDRRLKEATERYKSAARKKSINVNPGSAKYIQKEMDESLADILANRRD